MGGNPLENLGMTSAAPTRDSPSRGPKTIGVAAPARQSPAEKPSSSTPLSPPDSCWHCQRPGALGFRASPTKVINATNGESVETAPFGTGYYGTDGGGEVYAFHPGGANIACGDASVKMLGPDISIRLFSSLVTRAGGEVIAGDKDTF